MSICVSPLSQKLKSEVADEIWITNCVIVKIYSPQPSAQDPYLETDRPTFRYAHLRAVAGGEMIDIDDGHQHAIWRTGHYNRAEVG